MRNVAEESGTAGSLFAGFPIQVAGKTGTAENFGGTDHGWFVAYAPYEHPRIVIAVLTEQGGFGSLSSGPIVRSMRQAWNTGWDHDAIKHRAIERFSPEAHYAQLQAIYDG